jgi:hypothetical protein
VAAFQSDPSLLTASFVRYSRTQGAALADHIAWLTTTQQAALAAVFGGDLHVANLANEGSSTAWLREIPANQLAQLCEVAMQQLEAEAASIAAGLTGAPPVGNLHFADFSGRPCTLG